MKERNPLYVVKGKTVLEAKGVFDLILKKFNLEPVYQLLLKLINFLMEQVKDYPTYLAVKKAVDDLMEKLTGLTQKFHRT